MPVSSSANTAQASPSGTVAMMMMALTKLSNCAASTSRMMTSAKAKMVSMLELLSPSVAASASGSIRLPGGSSGAAISSARASASPSAKPGARLEVMATERSCCSRDREGGTACSVSVAMVDSGTKRLSPVFMKMFSRSVGSLIGLVVETSFTA